MLSNHLWWQHGIIYQIYPRSFLDTNGDGVGDLAGITHKLDYLKWLSVNAIWISPIYPSPMADFGYDVADYTGIHPIFGSMADFDELLHAAYQRDIKVILDLVPNHTSNQHPWFIESRSSRDNPKRDWYLWHDPHPESLSVPNNWLSVFGGSAWEWNEHTGQYYYHAFLKEQPDLNWRNPAVQKAMLDIMRFWLDKGVDGFRVDVMWHMIKDVKIRDNPPNFNYQPGNDPPYHQFIPAYSTDQPEVHGIVAQMRKLLNQYNDRVMIGEVYLPINQLVTYYGENGSGAHMPFNFQLIIAPWDAQHIFSLITEYEASLPVNGWPNWVLGNHDQSRIVSRIGLEQAKVAAILLLTLRGTPTIYYGEEIGMRDVAIPPELIVDPQEKNQHGEVRGRDPERTPMQWDTTRHAGFSAANPWLPVAPDYESNNVAVERDKLNSMLIFYRRLILLRQNEPALQIGDYVPVGISKDSFAYIRQLHNRRLLIAVNLGHTAEFISFENITIKGRIIFTTHSEHEGNFIESCIELAGDEGIIVALED